MPAGQSEGYTWCLEHEDRPADRWDREYMREVKLDLCDACGLGCWCESIKHLLVSAG